jgi:nucleotide-binding universal stress UspA family protein
MTGRKGEEVVETFQPKVILCPTDFSELATLALRYGVRLANCFGARLMVLYSDPFSPPPYFTSGQVENLSKEIERSRGKAREYLIGYVKEHVGNLSATEMVVVQNEPVPAILNAAEQGNAGLIVMGTHGRGDFRRFLLGSVAEKILHETDRPVLTVREKRSGGTASRVSIQHVLCPINYTEVAFKALEHAVAVSKCFGAELLVLHVIESSAADVTDQGEHARLCSWIPDETRARCSLKEIIRRGDAAEQIIEMASSTACDMIVLGAQHKRFSDTTVIGTTTLRVTRHAPCPVLTIVHK